MINCASETNINLLVRAQPHPKHIDKVFEYSRSLEKQKIAGLNLYARTFSNGEMRKNQKRKTRKGRAIAWFKKRNICHNNI